MTMKRRVGRDRRSKIADLRKKEGVLPLHPKKENLATMGGPVLTRKKRGAHVCEGERGKKKRALLPHSKEGGIARSHLRREESGLPKRGRRKEKTRDYPPRKVQKRKD